jgi:Family of unknown function (DUF6134)
MGRLVTLPLPRSAAAAWLLATGIGLAVTAPVRAADSEVRTFAVSVEGTKSGDYKMTIATKHDGTVVMSGQAEVNVKVLLVTAYSYAYNGVEVWKDGRLQRFDSSATENGKRYAVTAAAAGDQLRVKVNGQERLTRPDVWVNTYWRLPEAKFRGQTVPLLGCDYGHDDARELKFVGNEQLTVNGQTMSCAHYRILTEPAHDLWYDAQERLVRQEWTSSGRKTVLELTGVWH